MASVGAAAQDVLLRAVGTARGPQGQGPAPPRRRPSCAIVRSWGRQAGQLWGGEAGPPSPLGGRGGQKVPPGVEQNFPSATLKLGPLETGAPRMAQLFQEAGATAGPTSGGSVRQGRRQHTSWRLLACRGGQATLQADPASCTTARRRAPHRDLKWTAAWWTPQETPSCDFSWRGRCTAGQSWACSGALSTARL